MEDDCQGGSFLQRERVGGLNSQMRHGGGPAMETEGSVDSRDGEETDLQDFLPTENQGGDYLLLGKIPNSFKTQFVCVCVSPF